MTDLERVFTKKRVDRIKHRVLVLSGKGGVGKSTVAANLAIALAEGGGNVGLLDVDIHGPSIPQILGLNGSSPTYAGQQGKTVIMRPVQAADNLHVMSTGFLLDSRETAVIWRGPMKYNVIKQFLTDVEWGDLDYLVVDSPPGTGDEPLSVAQLLGTPSHAVIVTTPQELALSDVRRCVTFCRQLNVSVLGVVENMSGFVCPHCGEKTAIFKTGGGRVMAEEAGIPFLGSVPIDPSVVVAGDSGIPNEAGVADSPAWKALAEVVERALRNLRGQH